MRRVKGADTGPERRLRGLLRALGYPGYRLQRRDLPGRPDVAYLGRRRAIFMHGCFWHGHDCPRGARIPKTNTVYWTAKISRNKARDAAAVASLTSSGWRVAVVWECELKDEGALKARLDAFMRDG